ncbi:MAG: glycosyltransferase family 4 protein [Acidobacteriota bacterium]|nr:MAG: glycosyltransferase family 4 protein [Acidobacteriota bacterium]
MRVAALVPYHQDYCAGQRFRVETWARHLQPRGISFSFLPFASPELTSVLYERGHLLTKAVALARCSVEQTARVLRESRPDVVYIYREASLVGPALIERLTRRWRAPIVYDLDEPLFMSYVSPSNGRLSALKWFSKTDDLIRMSDQVWVVNRAIGDYASRFSRRVEIVPMAVDTERYMPAPPLAADAPLRVGWVGTRTSQINLEAVVEPLARLHQSHGAMLSVVADQPLSFDGVPVEFVPWSWEGEVASMHKCQIALVPVKPDSWSPWKFYYKLVQCMSMGIPVVASPIGSNLEIVEDGRTGFLADTPDDWYDRLRRLADDPELRRAMGAAARRVVEERFSLEGQLEFLERELKEAAA